MYMLCGVLKTQSRFSIFATEQIPGCLPVFSVLFHLSQFYTQCRGATKTTINLQINSNIEYAEKTDFIKKKKIK